MAADRGAARANAWVAAFRGGSGGKSASGKVAVRGHARGKPAKKAAATGMMVSSVYRKPMAPPPTRSAPSPKAVFDRQTPAAKASVRATVAKATAPRPTASRPIPLNTPRSDRPRAGNASGPSGRPGPGRAAPPTPSKPSRLVPARGGTGSPSDYSFKKATGTAKRTTGGKRPRGL